jgi:hypothetical protein
MRLSILTAALAAACAFAPGAHAVVQCQLSGVPLEMRAHGLAEPVGEVVLRCMGGAPFSSVEGTFQLAISSLVANRPDQGYLNEAGVALDLNGTWQPLFGVRARLLEPNSVVFDPFVTSFDANGQLGLRFSGVRSETRNEVIALVGFSGNPQLPVPVATVVVGRGTGIGLGAVSTATIPRASPELPPDVDFAALVNLRAPFITTRFTESGAAVLRPRANQHEGGVRVVVQFPGVPEGGRVFVPAAIAGSSALQPTSGGNLGAPPAGGQYMALPAATLVLSLIRGADPDGVGGNQVFFPLPSINTLDRVEPAEFVDGLHYAVYEVLDANQGQLESAQFPAWVVMPPDWRAGGPVLRSQVSIGPVSDARGAQALAPVPRFAANVAANDCGLVNDCAAPYFPHLRVTPITPTEFTAPAGSGHQIGNVIVENTGGNLLEWVVTVRYMNGADWVRFFPAAGVDRATVRYDVLPAALAPGEYRAELVITGAAGAGVSVTPIVLRVTEPLPPAEPPPVVRDVVKAGNRLPGPVAPGSLAIVLGEGFTGESSVIVGGIPARVLLAEPGELLIEVPPAIDPALARAPVVVDRGGLQSTPWGVELAPVAPAVLFALNEDDGERNGAGFPVMAGRVLQLYVTGLMLAVEPVFVRIHDRDIEDLLREDGFEQAESARLLRFIVPEDLPAMRTAVLVCGRAAEGAEAVCAQPFDVYLEEAP